MRVVRLLELHRRLDVFRETPRARGSVFNFDVRVTRQLRVGVAQMNVSEIILSDTLEICVSNDVSN